MRIRTFSPSFTCCVDGKSEMNWSREGTSPEEENTQIRRQLPSRVQSWGVDNISKIS